MSQPRKTVRIESGIPVAGVHRMPVADTAVLEMLSAPITRVEWDAVRSAGRDPFDWFPRIPQAQKVLPEATVTRRDGDTVSRVRVGSNVSILRYS